ncbi:glycosyltransferase family 4 protein [Pedobacter punctiformis]|uniref:Glycosyltransferase family 4 protein n=1 Tax=Pedobacter punctiformis TaxID=3004097 RepID=A0ABT4L4S0_9SPHI|nr:glycosyltransferase family 4 protein [Pedobacter sp. HCMS5-2]MCZ4242910.1 glycosyltransferase family 4 protein [Pedobacter sp. HCMS5-2]
MRILVVSQYFWPENFRINDFVLGLQEKGHEIEVLTGKPNYPKGKYYSGYSFFGKRTEIWNGIKIHRAPLFRRHNGKGLNLAFNYLSFMIFGTLRSLTIKGKFDHILVFQPSPITTAIPAIFLKWLKKASLFIWVQDLWPHSVTAAGGIHNKSIIKFLDSLTKWIYKRCDKILIQSEGFRNIINEQGIDNSKIEFYPNTVETFFKKTAINNDCLSLLPNGFKIMFAGNIGEAQDFETIIEAAKIVAQEQPDIKWIILGDGRKKHYLHQKVLEYGLEGNFILLGSFPVEKMPYFFACADCLLVSLKKDFIFSLTIPSKLQSYLACSKPILASLDGEGANIVKAANAGFTANAEDPIALASQVIKLRQMPTNQLVEMGENGGRYFQENFNRDVLLIKIIHLFRQFKQENK